MKSTPKWLIVPPIVAVLLILGPLSMQGTTDSAIGTPPADPPAATEAQPGSLVPRTPDMWKLGSTLVGVLLLGVGGLFALRKLRGGAAPTGGTRLATLRQSLRLSAKQALHAIEFDDRILLVGEHERGLVLIERGRLPDRVDDEAEVLQRTAIADEPEEEGAVPKNLVIPRPDPATPARGNGPARASDAKVAAATAQLNSFRNLLQKAAR